MSSDRMSLLGLYKYDNTLFSKLVVPDEIDKETLINNILLQAANFEIIYSDASFMRDCIGLWSTKWQRTFQKWVEIQAIDYDPLYNYNRYEEWTDTNRNTSNGSGSSSSMNTNNKSSFDSSDFQPYDQDIASGNTTAQQTVDDNGTHTGHMYGNIGVTTTQAMERESYSVAEWNVYEHITDIFIQEFCILVY